MAQPVDDLQTRLSDLLADRQTTIAVAESLTGGELSAKFACVPGSSEWFRGGIVAYASEVKYDLLEVPVGPVVSEAAAIAMARSARRLLAADIGLAVTGVAGPDEQDGEAPGTVWMALSDRHGTTAKRCTFTGPPNAVVDATERAAVEWVLLHCANAGALDQASPS